MNQIESGTKRCIHWYRKWSTSEISPRCHTPMRQKNLPSLKNNTWRYWKLPERNTRTFQQTLIIGKGIIYSWEWRNTCGIICYFCMISGYLLLITKRKGFWGIISGNRHRPWHLGVSKVSIISANAWACLFWCTWKNQRIYLTECPRYLDKENRWLWLLSVYTIGFLKSS